MIMEHTKVVTTEEERVKVTRGWEEQVKWRMQLVDLWVQSYH